MVTAANESDLGTYLYSLSGESSYGIFQMQKRTEKDLIENYISHRPKLKKIYEDHKGNLATDLSYQIIMARIYYLRDKHVIPSQPLEIVKYYKRVWNTKHGKATVKVAFRKYLFLCV